MKTQLLKEETEYIRQNAMTAEIVYVPNSHLVAEIKYKIPVIKIGFRDNQFPNGMVQKYIFSKINKKSKILKEIENQIKFIPGKDDEKKFPRYAVDINSIKYQKITLDKSYRIGNTFYNTVERVDCKLLK